MKVKNKKVKVKNYSLSVLRQISLSSVCLCIFAVNGFSQSGGAFTIEKSAISSSGGTVSGGAFTVESTIGQPSAGLSQYAPFILFGGFITPTLAPTAANVSISGRVTTGNGAGIRNISVTLTYPNGTTRTVSTGTFGAYRFEDVPVGEVYVVFVQSRKFTFNNPTQVISVSEQINDLNFIATEQ